VILLANLVGGLVLCRGAPLHRPSFVGGLMTRLAAAALAFLLAAGGPIEEPADYELSHWAGVIPVTLERGEPQLDRAGRTTSP